MNLPPAQDIPASITNPADCTPIYLAYRGSVAHGTADPDPESLDDIDLMGFVVGRPHHYLGLDAWEPRGTREIRDGRYDAVLYDLPKAVRLLLQGNPNLMSMLWTQPKHHLHLGYLGQMLLVNRGLFDSRQIYHSYAGYASGQLAKATSRDPAELREYIAVTAELKYRGLHPNTAGQTTAEPDRNTGELRDVQHWDAAKLIARMRYFHKKGENLAYMGEKRKQLVLELGADFKNLAHMVRLLRMCIEYLKTGEMRVERPDAQELRDIKTGKWPLEQVQKLGADLFQEAKAAYETSTLPDEPDRRGADRMLTTALKYAVEFYQ